MVRLTADYIVKCNGHTKRQKDEPMHRYLKRITHLYMAGRNIEAIDNLSACRNLTVLYLYDNKLNQTLNLGTAQTLTHLYVQNNNITKIEGIGHLYRLTKLYIGYNSISVVEGLQNLSQLSELHIEHQRIPAGEKVLFEPRTLTGLSKGLSVLNVSENHMNTISELSILSELSCLIAGDNLLTDIDDVAQALGSWKQLQKLELTGNPICHKAKYRDNIIVKSQSLDLLDGKKINTLERKFLMSWKASREARGRMKLESRLMGETGNLPPLQTTAAHPVPPPHYTLGGLPGGRKRFKEVLVKSRSFPASAMPSGVQEQLQGPSLSFVRQTQNRAPPTLGAKSISDVTNLKSEREMTPHPNTTQRTRNRPVNGVLKVANEHTSHTRPTHIDKFEKLGDIPRSNGHQMGSINYQTHQRFTQRTGFSGHATRSVKSEQDLERDTGVFTAQDIPTLRKTGSSREDSLVPSEGLLRFGKPVFLLNGQNGHIADHGDIPGLLAPMPSPRVEGGEGVPTVNSTSPRPIAVPP